jgi:hypothetical protein
MCSLHLHLARTMSIGVLPGVEEVAAHADKLHAAQVPNARSSVTATSTLAKLAPLHVILAHHHKMLIVNLFIFLGHVIPGIATEFFREFHTNTTLSKLF